ncbi:hypothetical protein ACA910_011979 [Epithemia clementina (nom. ined.)]
MLEPVSIQAFSLVRQPQLPTRANLVERFVTSTSTRTRTRTTTTIVASVVSSTTEDSTATTLSSSSSSSSPSSTTKTIAFGKYHGLGNDFILIDNRDQTEPCLTPEQAMQWCHRNFGIGADGVIFALTAPPSSNNDKDEDEYDFSMRIYNSDGSEPEMCGNGIRCLAKFVHDKDNRSSRDSSNSHSDAPVSYKIHTLAGLIVPVLNPEDGSITVDMGKPIFTASKVPTTLEPNFEDGDSVVEQTVVAPNNPDKMWKITAVSMGNPHAVIFVDDLDRDVDLAVDGPALESATHLFPSKANVEFVQVRSDSHLEMRVWERGAGPTLACGTGACALVVAAIRAHKIPPTPPQQPCRVTLPGGDLWIEWNADNNKVYMTGPATLAFTGEATI